jgi:hypothetical protein
MSDTAKAFLAAQAAAVGAPAPLAYPDAQAADFGLPQGGPPSSGFSGLIEYFNDFVPRFLRKKNGTPVGRRQAQIIAKEHNLPLIRLGNAVYIDIEKAAERLREAQLVDRREPRGRGRPRKG